MNLELKKNLQDGNVIVKFTKVDGTEREMRCTLKEGVVPQYERKTETKHKKHSDEVCSVWDVDLAAWRSFRWDAVKEFSVCE